MAEQTERAEQTAADLRKYGSDNAFSYGLDRATALEAADFIDAAIRVQQERENPMPLTLNQLCDMEGDPIWTITLGVVGSGRYELCTAHVLNALPLRCVTADGEIHDYDQETYGKTWVAYASKPKGAEHD